ncbi:MAG: HEPN domain-containing protein [Candidatus Aminicenantes bacterium]|nr:HEPN domain-containing protein [Candidatus Aminicenantes bacterium]
MEQRKLDLMKYRMDRAKETAQEAELALANNKLRLAENRIYYAIFYIVHALSILENFSTAKHVTLKGWFNKEFVATGKIDAKFYKIYNRAFDKRQEGDYDDFVIFEKEEVIKDLNDMKEFLGELEIFIKSQLPFEH